MSEWAQQCLDAVYSLPPAEDARIELQDGVTVFDARVIPLSSDEVLGSGMQASPVMGVQIVEVRKTQWAERPERGDLIHILTAPGGEVVRSLTVADNALSLDDKRLTWSMNCSED